MSRIRYGMRLISYGLIRLTPRTPYLRAKATVLRQRLAAVGCRPAIGIRRRRQGRRQGRALRGRCRVARRVGRMATREKAW